MEKTLADFLPQIQQVLSAESILKIDKMQSLWSDYGAIFRLTLSGSNFPSVVVKCISLDEKGSHPRGWSTNRSHQRKLKSYQIENHWYENYAGIVPATAKVPELLYSEKNSTAQVLVLEDLSIVYPGLKQKCTFREAKTVVKWLAEFHAHFLNTKPTGLWQTGSYWHLETRQEEWQAMAEGVLKQKAAALDQALSEAKYQTIIHGDAKVANFCFAGNGKVAAVDFQYVGKGVGVKDLAYFIGSCFTSNECELYEDALLDFYFAQLHEAIEILAESEKVALEKEWRALYPVAWADFNRFLMGWLPGHQKLHRHALAKNEEAIKQLAYLV